MRPGEVITMRREEIDMSGPVWEYRPAADKTEHRGGRRVVMIGPKAQAIIREFLRPEIQCSNLGNPPTCFHRNTTASPVAIALASLGIRYTVTSYRRAISRACVRASVPEWSPNQLRHSAATRIRRELGLDVALARYWVTRT